MAKRVSDEEREAIIAELDTGKTCNQIARKFGRASGTISRIARDVGHQFAQSNASRARELKAVYDDERRAKLKLMHADLAEWLMSLAKQPAKIMKIGGKDNVYTEHAIDYPTFQDQRDLSTAVANYMRTINQMDQTDTGRGDLGILDIIFQRIESEADEYVADAG